MNLPNLVAYCRGKAGSVLRHYRLLIRGATTLRREKQDTWNAKHMHGMRAGIQMSGKRSLGPQKLLGKLMRKSALVICMCAFADMVAAESEQSSLESVVVTAQRREENLEKVPISISLLGGKDLDTSSFSGVTDALRIVPGLASSSQFASGSTSFSLRGVSSGRGALGNGAGPVAYYIDGVPFGFIRNGFYPADPSIYDLQRIEVLNGPQGTLYGANALSGVIRVLTQDPDGQAFGFKVRTSVSATDDGGENHRGDLSLNLPIIDGKLAARAVVGFQDDSGWIDTPIKRDVNDTEGRNYRLKVRAVPTETLTIDLSAWRSEQDTGAPSLSDDNRRSTSLLPQPGEQKFSTYGLEIGKEFSSVSISSMTSYIDYSSHTTPNGRPASIPVTLDNTFTSEVVSQEVNLVSELDAPWRWSAGAFYRDAEDVKYQLFVSTLGSSVNDYFTDESKSYAVYGEIGHGFLDDQLDLSLGLRYFHDDQSTILNKPYAKPAVLALPPLASGSTFDSDSERITPRAILTWTPTEDRTWYASYSQGFRSGFTQQPNVQASFPTFASVDPDRLTNYEIGAKGSIGNGRLAYEAAVFYIDWQDVQRSITVFIPGTPIPNTVTTTAVVNGTSARGVGASFAFTTRPFDGLEIGGNITWNDLALDGNVVSSGVVIGRKGERLAFSPEYTAGISAEYRWNLGGGFGMRIATSGNYLPSNFGDPSVRTGAVARAESDELITAQARLALETPEHWSAALYADNLTDENGSPGRTTGLSGDPIEWSTRIRPRTIGLQIDYHFGPQ